MHWSRFCPPEMEMEMDHHPFGHLRSDKLTCRGGGGAVEEHQEGLSAPLCFWRFPSIGAFLPMLSPNLDWLSKEIQNSYMGSAQEISPFWTESGIVGRSVIQWRGNIFLRGQRPRLPGENANISSNFLTRHLWLKSNFDNVYKRIKN